jgi:uncharacterized sulfatase
MGGPGTTGVPGRNGFDFWMGYLDQSEAHNYYPESLWRNAVRVPLPGNRVGAQRRVSVERVTYAHDVMTEEALAFIDRNRERPFLLHVHWTIPHANNERGRATGNGQEVPELGEYAARQWPAPEQGFAAMVTRLDRDVGRLIERLRTYRIERRTLVLFTSDNGPHSEGGHDHRFFDSNGPLRGYKRDLYEGGIRVPLIAWWPGTVAPGTTDHPSASWDFLPTACELAGIEPPADTDGISFAPTLRGDRDRQRQHPFLYWQFRGKRALRAGGWKLVRPDAEAPLELYDLARDLGEEHDVAARHPDVVRRLRAVVESVERDGD